eukprot:TRINITY_DN1900_c0_g1_i3.p1 TRINITY_DN1900_c0_g1~~TRINITY_DN1900_c0_g1_i3.p1  ORF type:complete len:170 (-),score=9.64 TRINITY_DN1900_c0_g1_i3:147-656(-)
MMYQVQLSKNLKQLVWTVIAIGLFVSCWTLIATVPPKPSAVDDVIRCTMIGCGPSLTVEFEPAFDREYNVTCLGVFVDNSDPPNSEFKTMNFTCYPKRGSYCSSNLFKVGSPYTGRPETNLTIELSGYSGGEFITIQKEIPSITYESVWANGANCPPPCYFAKVKLADY